MSVYDPPGDGVVAIAAPSDTPFTIVPGAVNSPDAAAAASLALTTRDAQWLRLIKADLGNADPADPAIVAAYDRMYEALPTVWALYIDKLARGVRLRYLYAKRHAVLMLRGHAWQAVSNTDGIEESLSDQGKSLAAMYADMTDEIAVIEGSEDAARGPMIAQIARTAPITPDYPGLQPDPNSRRLRGDPLRGGFGQGYGRGW